MYILGKLIGGAFGALVAGPVGLVVGVIIGHYFDQGLAANLRANAHTAPARAIFFQTTFQMMGYLAKADGRVSAEEIQMARQVMDHLQLTPDQKVRAIEYFNQGKSPHFEWEPCIDHFMANCGYHPQLMRMFVEILLQVAFVDGALTGAKRQAMWDLCAKLHIPRAVLEQIEQQYYAEQAFDYSRTSHSYSHRQSHSQSQQTYYSTAGNELKQAYSLLGVSESDTDQEVKKAYRRLMSQNHPDKLVAKGLPPEMLKLATEKTQKIQKAYEWICKARGI